MTIITKPVHLEGYEHLAHLEGPIYTELKERIAMCAAWAIDPQNEAQGTVIVVDKIPYVTNEAEAAEPGWMCHPRYGDTQNMHLYRVRMTDLYEGQPDDDYCAVWREPTYGSLEFYQ